MSRRFQTANREQLLLLSPSIDDWVEEEHLVRFLSDCVEQFDLSRFYASYSAEGGAAWDPKMLLTVMLYAWCMGIRSSRKIAAACRDHMALRWATGNRGPDHCAFARFFRRHEEAIRELFAQVLLLCHRAGALRVGHLSLDGTKIRGNASLSANRTLARLREEIVLIEEEMRRSDAADDARFGESCSGEELPPALRDRHARLERLRSARDQLELELAAERALRAGGGSNAGRFGREFSPGSCPSSPCGLRQGALWASGGAGESVESEATAGCASELESAPAPVLPEAEAGQAVESAELGESEPTGKRGAGERQAESKGKKGKKGKKAKPDDERRVNLSDPDSRIMKGRQGHVQGYNAQAVVTSGQFVVFGDVVQDENDLHLLEPMVLGAQSSLRAAGIEETAKTVSADAGYWHEGVDVSGIEATGVELFVATRNRRKQARVAPRGRMPQGLTRTQRMERKMATQAGRSVYRGRSCTVEPVFGQLKECLDGRRFLRRGLEHVRSEWSFLCACFNLRKLCAWLRTCGRSLRCSAAPS